MKKIIIAFYLMFLFGAVEAQINIRGVVLDNNNKSLSNAEVILPDINRGTITDSKGNFVLKKVKKGKVKLVVSHIGYNPQVLSLYVTKDTSLKVLLKSTVFKIKEVVVSGGYTTSQHDNAIQIDVIRSKKLESVPVPNVMMSLSQRPEVSVVSRGNGIMQPVVRGLTSNNVVVLVDGVRLENYQFSVNHPFLVDGLGVSRVEVIKGPASLLYGSDAVGGTINFITYTPPVTDTVYGSGFCKVFSNGIGYSTGGEATVAKKKYYATVRVGNNYSYDYRDGHNVIVPNTRFENSQMQFNLGYRGYKHNINIWYRYMRPKLGLYVPNVSFNNSYKLEQWYQNLTDNLLVITDKAYLGKTGILTNKLSFQNNRRQLVTIKPAIDMNLSTFNYSLQYHYYLFNKKYEIISGANMEYQKNANNVNAPNKIIPDAFTQELSVYTLVKRDFDTRLHLQAGLRFDKKQISTNLSDTLFYSVNNEFSNLSFSLGGTYEITENLLLRANVASGYRVPALPELTQKGLHGDRYEYGNPNLLPQQNIEVDGGIHIHSDKFLVNMDLYVNRLWNYIYLSPLDSTINGFKTYEYQQDDAQIYGVEVSTYYKLLRNIVVGAETGIIKGIHLNGEPLPFIPQNKVRASIKYQIPKWKHFSYPFVEVSLVDNLPKTDVPLGELKGENYLIANYESGFTYRLSSCSLTTGFSIFNLLNTYYYDRLSSLAYWNFGNVGRNFSIFVKIKF